LNTATQYLAEKRFMTSNKVDLTTLLDKFPKQTTTKDKLRATSALLETLRIFSQLGDNMLYSVLEYIAESAMQVEWQNVDFSFTKKLLAYKNPEIALEALTVFSELVESDPAHASEVLLDSILEEIEARQPKQAVTVAEIYTERMLGRVFKPAVFSNKLASTFGAGLVAVRGTLAFGEIGPAIRGLAFDSGVSVWSTILETGEYVSIPKSDTTFALKVTEDADDYANVCPALLLYTLRVAEELKWAGVLSDELEQQITQGHALGVYTQPVHHVRADKENVKSLAQVLDYARDKDHITPHTTGPLGATVRFTVPGTDMTVVLDALPSQTGPYVVARLMRGETTLMRLDHPRYFSARGVYFFPLPKFAVSLTVMY
jgi:hypothetical protein